MHFSLCLASVIIFNLVFLMSFFLSSTLLALERVCFYFNKCRCKHSNHPQMPLMISTAFGSLFLYFISCNLWPFNHDKCLYLENYCYSNKNSPFNSLYHPSSLSFSHIDFAISSFTLFSSTHFLHILSNMGTYVNSIQIIMWLLNSVNATL